MVIVKITRNIKVQDKITDLEIRLTHQEAEIQAMNKVILKQHSQIESLLADITSLKKQLREMGSGNIVDQSLETPPPPY